MKFIFSYVQIIDHMSIRMLKAFAYISPMTIKLQRQQAYEKIKRAIVTLRFEMGKNINEQDLCQEFNLGRTPVREALQLLASEGLAVVVPRKGVYWPCS
jgi:DNA-binding GntR family transcriptional regulator